jgi:DNA-binding response OmpR family regulator
MRDGLTRLLQKWGYEVRAASSAEEALAVADVDRPALVLTELVLPKINGIGLLQALQETRPRPAVLL